MKIFITGGTGFVGSCVVAELQNRGHELVALVRRMGSLHGTSEIVGDVTRPLTFPPEKIEGCQAALHLVGLIREFPKKGITFQGVHVEGTKNVLEACRRAGIPRFLHMSAIGEGHRSGAFYQRTKAEAENLVRASSMRWTIFRPSTILGKGGEFLEMMQSTICRGVVPLPGGGRSQMAPVAVSTVAQAFANALERDESCGKIYDLGGEAVSYRSLLEKIASKTGRNPFYVNIPIDLLRIMAAVLDSFSFFPVTREQLTMLQEKAVPSNNEVYKELGLEFKRIDRVLEEVLGGA